MSGTGASMQAKRARMRELHCQGTSANAIGGELGVHPSTISRWAKAEGLSFNRSKVAEAVAVKSIDLAAGRQRLAERMLASAEDMLDCIDDPYVVYTFGDKDNTFEQATLSSTPSRCAAILLRRRGSRSTSSPALSRKTATVS